MLFDESTLKAILSHYDFYSGKIDQFEVVPQRLTNLNARFRIDEKQRVIKRYNDRNTPQRLALSHQVQQFLTAHQFPVARLEQTHSSATLVEHGEHYYSVHEWVSGQHIDGINLHAQGKPPADDIIREVAKGLGHYHRLMQGQFLAQERMDHDTVSAALRQPANIAVRIGQKRRREPLRTLQQKLRLHKTPLEKWLQNALDPLMRQAEQLANIDPASSPAMHELIVAHNDINWENLIFDDAARLRAIIDFDNAAILPRLFEVGAAAIVIAGTHRRQRELFLDAYRQASGLDTEPSALATGMKIKCLRSMLWSALSYMQGTVADSEMLAEWCFYLDACLQDINATPPF